MSSDSPHRLLVLQLFGVLSSSLGRLTFAFDAGKFQTSQRRTLIRNDHPPGLERLSDFPSMTLCQLYVLTAFASTRISTTKPVAAPDAGKKARAVRETPAAAVIKPLVAP